MVRETRHLWVGNLPDNIREERIREHFKRYGRVQNVKLLGRTEAANAGASVAGVAISGVCATVAFMDIKSASKAHNAEHVLDERTLTTEYYEPAAIPSAAGAPSAGSSPAGSGYSGSSSSVNSAPAPAPASVSRYHLSGGEEGTGTTCAIAATAAAPANWRGTNDSASDYCRRGNTPATFGRYQRNNSNTPYATTPPSNVERTTPHHRWYASTERGATGTESTPSTPGGGTESGRRRRRSGSGSSRSDSSSPEPSDASRASTPAGPPSACNAVAARTPPAHHHQWASTASGRPLAICVRNLPTRSTDSSLKDGLYHEYKKHGKVVWVKVVGQNADRYAVVRFKKPSDVEKALEVSQDKLFFGCKISVAPHQSCDEDADSAKPYETDIDEYHPKATRTLFIGNLEKDVTQQQLRDKFKHFGRIIEIDIKKGSGGGAGYAFCQYASISSVVEAIRAMDGEYVGGSRVKLGFGKPVATTCVWVDGLTEHTEKQVLGCVSRCGAATSVCVDRAAGAALVHFEQAAAAGAAVRELRRVAAQACAAEPDRVRLAVDYASRECQEAFYEQLEKHGGSAALTGTERLSGDLTPRYIPSTRHEPVRYGDGVGSRSRASSYGRGSSRTPRYSTLEHYDPADYAADRRYRVYDELGSSPQAEDTPYEDRLQSVVVSPHRARRHRRDSSPDDRKHSKERHRGVVGTGTRRSRSGSHGGGEKHATRRRHRRRREGSGSRAGTPLRDELDALPAEPRRPPRDRPPLPMSLPLPKFAAQLLRTAPTAPRPAPAPAPDSPPRPPSASSSSAGSAPHSPSLEERIRSLDEKYEKWSGSRVIPEAADRTRLRHRLLEVDINEVKPSEVVRSLLAKRSVFDEDSERLEGATRAPSPSGSPRARAPPCVPRALRYPFPAHPPPHAAACQPPAHDADADVSDRPADPRLNRPERPYLLERLGKFSESDYRLESRIRLRTPSTDKSQLDSSDRRHSPRGDRERPENERDPRRDIERRRRDSFYSGRESDSKSSSIDADEKDVKDSVDKVDADHPTQESECLKTVDSQPIEESVECFDDKLLTPSTDGGDNEMSENQKASRTESSLEDSSIREKVADILSNHVGENLECETEKHIEKQSVLNTECSIKSDDNKLDLLKNEDIPFSQADKKFDHSSFQSKHEMDKCKEILIQNQINKELIEFEMQLSHLNVVNSIKPSKEIEDSREFIKSHDKNGKERYNQNMILEAFHNIKCEKENIEFDKTSEKDKCSSHSFLSAEKKHSEIEKNIDDRGRSDKEKVKHCKDRSEKDRHDHERDKSKSSKHDKATEKNEKEKKTKDETTVDKSHPSKTERVKLEKETDRSHKDKNDRSETDKSKHIEEKQSNHRHDHHRKDKVEKDKRKDGEPDSPKTKKDDKLKHEKPKKENTDSKRDSKKDADSIKSRKSSRDESLKDLCRKDSTDSSTSRASHDSIKVKEELVEIKEEPKPKAKFYNDKFTKPETEKDHSLKSVDFLKTEGAIKIKTEIKEEKDIPDSYKIKIDNTLEQTLKCKSEITEKQRHYSVDSPSLECKRKERLNSCSSLPSHIGHKRRMSSQDSIDSVNEDGKKCKNESKCPERRDSKDSRSGERHKTTKFNKGHFAKLIESKTKDDKKNQVKPPDDAFLELSDVDTKKSSRKSPKGESEEKAHTNAESPPEGLRNDLDFLATLELRSSEEDERQKALRKEMKEKKRIQQLQQIQELQMQQEQHPELLGKFKDEKKQKTDEKKKDAAREKRMSTDRKSRDDKIDKNDNSKRKTRKTLQSTDTSDSDEPKKHSIFDIVDDEPTYISMYDKVKARSCKNMQKQEEEKRQEKIKAKFSQLKQSRAKREEKKRSSWDEDSDSENDRRKSQRISMGSSSDDENVVMQSKKREKSHGSLDYDHSKTNDYFNIPSAEEDSRNKLSRKNSRTRIISDTSDDDASKRSISRSPCYLNDMRKEFMSEFDSLHKIKDDSVVSKESSDKIKKNSLLNLFGKSDSDDSKLKSSLESNDNKAGYMKTFLNDFSSESESISNRHSGEIRKKHKRKQKKHKFSFSDEETKVENNEIALNHDGETRHKNSEKLRRHNNKREKRKEKIRDSIDADDSRDDKFKSRKDKKPLNNCFDSTIEAGPNNIRKDGKMEDIFGPLSDESDRDVVSHSNKLDFTPHEYDSTFNITNDQMSTTINTENIKSRDKEDYRRRKEKRRRDKRPYTKEDENSLDVDAVSKAIEARLIADTMTDDDNRPKTESLSECVTKSHQNDINSTDKELFIEASKISDRQIEKMKRDFREKKKKKKKNKDDRPSRKDHHHFNNIEKYDKVDNLTSEKSLELSPKSMLLDIPLPNDPLKVNNEQKSDDRKALSESPSLPRLTDSPPNSKGPGENADSKNKDSDTPDQHSGDHNMNIDCIVKNDIEVNDIPMPPPPFENIVQDISEVPLPKDPIPASNSDVSKEQHSLPSFETDVDVSEDAVRSISNLDKDTEKACDKIDAHASKVEKKSDEKPRAIISQEETEDAVAALLGESFGGKINTFTNCYEEAENSPAHQIEIESTTIENENIPEEDAEEMRQAVQNLNASEMEMKPDTPVSDNDLLLIDTDTEEADDAPQDSIDRLPVNIIATNQSLNNGPEQAKPSEVSSVVIPKSKSQQQTPEATESKLKLNENEIKLQLPKRETILHATSTATPVITSWTLSNNKVIEPHVLNIQQNKFPNRDTNDNKPTHITANIVQIKAPQNQGLSSSLRPIIAPTRVSAPYQVINHMIRPQAPNMQPPTIKIPEPHILYQKPSGIVISPRMTNDSRLQSPKASPQEGMTSPRLANMTILSTSPQSLNSVGLASPNTIQQRSPGQVTVVRMQQPPLSPIQAMHLPHGARSMISPNRPNSVLVQTQGAPIQFNRLPVTPVLAPISKQMSTNNLIQQNKGIGINSSPLHQQKIIAGDCRKTEQRNITENLSENSKIILSPTTLQHSTNPTVMAQNRLISMQNAIHAGNLNPTLHLANKVLLNNVSHIADSKRENLTQKSEQHNHIPFGSAPIIHVTGVNHSTASIIQSGSKPVMCTLQETNTINRAQGSNVIHTLNSQRLLTTAPISSVIQIDANKCPPSVLSMATIRSPTVLTKLESSNSVAVTTSSLSNVVMTPLLLKSSSTPGTIRLSTKSDVDHPETHAPAKLQNHLPHHEDKPNVKNDPPKREMSTIVFDAMDKQKQDILLKPKLVTSPVEFTATKCETDFEELLKDNTNEIKVTNDPEKKLEVNVGKNVTLFAANAHCRERKNSAESFQKEVQSESVGPEKSLVKVPLSDGKEEKVFNDDHLEKEIKDVKDSLTENSHSVKIEPEVVTKDSNLVLDKDPLSTDFDEMKNDGKTPLECQIPINDENKTFDKITSPSESNQLKNLDDNDSWSAKDVNIESVIKKVDSLCNEISDPEKKDDAIGTVIKNEKNTIEPVSGPESAISDQDSVKPMEIETENEHLVENSSTEESSTEKTSPVSKRGGRSVRGKRTEKNPDRVQTRQISKPSRGGTSAKRGRGRAKVDKKIKSLVNINANNMPGDIYDFHEDSGDESATSPNKNETRPRLILTIKSPLSGQSNAIATSTLSITPKDQVKSTETKQAKEEKAEDFVSPSPNTRKSRRLQEKDVQRTTVDDVIEDVIKGATTQTKIIKDAIKKRPTRQAGVKVNQADKTGSDTRKSPRGVKRTRDRSLSDASVDSSDEKAVRRDDAPIESKVPKWTEPPVAPKVEPDPPQPAKINAPVINNAPVPTPTPIMKPPKKMISEISAKLASVFEAAASTPPPLRMQPLLTERLPLEAEKQPPPPIREPRNPEPATATPAASELMAVATGEARVSVSATCGADGLGAAGCGTGGEAALARRLDGVGGGMVPESATEAGDARVQSPALPHRPPDAHRIADRATPLLIRGGDGEGASVASVANVASGAGAGTARLPRGYAGTASLPRGAHHPPHPPHAPHPHLHHPHAKQVAVVGPHHHPGAASRVTITSVPTISPQGQIALGDGMYPHFSHQHYQMYQQHFRATQHESRATPSPYTRTLEAEGCEAPTPPLELRRPPSARVPRPAHSPSPADRLIMYAAGCGRSPPPAHGTSRLAGALPPVATPGPPHASQVPREADSLQMLLRRYPVMWQGLLALKNDSAAVQMHFVGGNPGVAGDTLPRHTDGSTPPLRIAQRMRLEPVQLDQVHRKMKLENEHCILLALPCGRDHMDVLQQSTNLTAGFITYLQRKQAAGIVNVAPPGHHQAMYTVHIFPSCDFANENLNRIAPDLMHRVADIAHLLIVIATV